MIEIPDLLVLAKKIAKDAGTNFKASKLDQMRGIEGTMLGGKEVKIVADRVLNDALLKALRPTGLPILSEESGILGEFSSSGLIWIVDPLDGSINYLRGIGPSAVSIALWQGSIPLFGVLYDLDKELLSWGGKNFGSWSSGSPIYTSTVNVKEQAIIFSGIPARFPIEDEKRVTLFFNEVSGFLKVRMIGSAAISLLKVAEGLGDAYFEDQVMLWDIAAGLAILEGAGGEYKIYQNNYMSPCKVFASNGYLLSSFID